MICINEHGKSDFIERFFTYFMSSCLCDKANEDRLSDCETCNIRFKCYTSFRVEGASSNG